MAIQYRHSYHVESVYGRVVELIREHRQFRGVHIDLACGYGAVAEPIRDLGLEYVGFDLDEESLTNLRSRGFESWPIDLRGVESVVQHVETRLSGRTLASISLIDVLEHVTDGPALLTELSRFALTTGALLVVSVPNVAHQDLSRKLLVGRWDYTEVGLLDYTHVMFYTNRLLDLITRRAGWREVSRADFHLTRSDQCFPKNHPLLSDSTPIGLYLRGLRMSSDVYGTVNQLVRAYLPSKGPCELSWLQQHAYARPGGPCPPFLTIITRTQGKRLANLREVLLCLAAQTCLDFELIVVAHRTTHEATAAIRRVVEDTPASLRSRATVHTLDHGNRTAPLNFGFERAAGEYVAALDDDDIVFAHWVETFRELSQRGPGCMLRAVCAEQDISPAHSAADAALGFKATSAIRTPYPSRHDFFAHLGRNFSPLMSLAFPRTVFSELGVRFDKEVDTAEDWDFSMRVAFVCGVAETEAITCIYRRWRGGDSSFSLHSEETWRNNYQEILRKMDSEYRLFPPGTVRYINSQQLWIDKLTADVASLQASLNTRARPVGSIVNFVRRHPSLKRVLRRCYYSMPRSVQRFFQ